MLSYQMVGKLLIAASLVFAATVAAAKERLNKTSNNFLNHKVMVQQSYLNDPNPFDTKFAKYVRGKGYQLTGSTNVGLRIFSDRLKEKMKSKGLTFSGTILSKPDEAVSIIMEEAKLRRKERRESRNKKGVDTRGAMEERMFISIPTPSATTMTLIGVELMIDDILNRVNSAASSALFAMRSHIAASISDLNVIFRNNMNDTFDRLSAEQQKILSQAIVLAAQAEDTIRAVEAQGFENAADLVCQTTANFANYNIGLPLKRLLKPDLLCLKEQNVRDVGPQFEQLLTFRGVRLMPNDEYPRVKITIAGQVISSTTGGGDAVLQLLVPGGVNGGPNDTSLRGDRIAQAEFSWPKAKIERRWLFTIKPYVVRSLEATMVPKIKGPIRKDKTQICSVNAQGGSIGSREEYVTCTILADDGWQIEECVESPPMSNSGNAGIRNRLYSVGACQWEMHAKSGAWYGAGAWYGFEGRARQKAITRIQGASFAENRIVNQSETSAVFEYPSKLVPPEYEILTGDWSWSLHYLDNTGRGHTLTESQPSQAGIGIGSIAERKLTFTSRP